VIRSPEARIAWARWPAACGGVERRRDLSSTAANGGYRGRIWAAWGRAEPLRSRPLFYVRIYGLSPKGKTRNRYRSVRRMPSAAN